MKQSIVTVDKLSNKNQDGGNQYAKSRLNEIFTKPTNQRPELNQQTLLLHRPINYIRLWLSSIS